MPEGNNLEGSTQDVSEFNIEFQPVGRRGQFQSGQSVLDCGRALGIGISSVCGGKGTCGKCRVQIVSGASSAPRAGEIKVLSPAQLASGWRLACQCLPTGDCVIHVPVESMTTPQRTQLEGLDTPVRLRSPVTTRSIEISPPSLADTMGDADRLRRTLREHRVRCDSVDTSLLKTLSPRLRDWSWRCKAVLRHGEVITVMPETGRPLGLAVDFGTTKLAGYLVDMSSGKTLASKGLMNPQISYGEDIIARCNLAISSAEGRERLQKLATEAIGELGNSMARSVGATAEDIAEAVVVGNTAMHHLCIGLPVRQLALAPFVPASSRALDIKARDLGLSFAPGAYVHLLPNIAGFVGADHVSMLLATDARATDGVVVALDIGTNTEVSLIHAGKIDSISCASGPAFEGGHIKDGMRAGTGAIERVRITRDGVDYATIDNAPPVGICGSGIIDTVAQLHLAGVADGGGRMRPGHPRVREHDGQIEFVLASQEERQGLPAVVFTQHDIRELQLGKAAIRAGVATLLAVNGLAEGAITQIVIAGAFGSYLDVSSALDIGMFPALPLERFRQVGNAAGMGAKRALISTQQRAEALTIAATARYIELAGSATFNKNFIQAVQLGRYKLQDGIRQEAN
jgi:uncharacterized 2Fe-2S/4Fe-4S cluster protein (DUF4445 family)